MPDIHHLAKNRPPECLLVAVMIGLHGLLGCADAPPPAQPAPEPCAAPDPTPLPALRPSLRPPTPDPPRPAPPDPPAESPFSALSLRCGVAQADADCAADAAPIVTFNAPLDPASIAGRVHVEPAVPGFAPRVDGDRLVLDGRWEPERAWTLRLDAGLKDRAGRATAAPFAASWRTATITADLALPCEGLCVMEADEPSSLSFHTPGLRELQVQIAERSPEELAALLAETRKARQLQSPQRALKLPVQAGQALTDAESLFGGARTGTVLVTVEADELRQRQQPRRAFVVQRTDLDLAFVADRTRVLILVNRLSTGAPVEGAEVRLLDARGKTLWSGPTDATGQATAPGPSALPLALRPFTLLATLEDDVATLPFDGSGSRGYLNLDPGVATEEEPRAFLLPDRASAAPATRAAVLGLLRRAGRPLEGVDGVSWSLASDERVRRGEPSWHEAPLLPGGLVYLDVPLPAAATAGPSSHLLTLRAGGWPLTATLRMQPARVAPALFKIELERLERGDVVAHLRATRPDGRPLANARLRGSLYQRPAVAPGGAAGFFTESPAVGPFAAPQTAQELLARTRTPLLMGPAEASLDATGTLDLTLLFGHPAYRADLTFHASLLDLDLPVEATATLRWEPDPVQLSARLPRPVIAAGEPLTVEVRAAGAPERGEVRATLVGPGGRAVRGGVRLEGGAGTWSSPPLRAPGRHLLTLSSPGAADLRVACWVHGPGAVQTEAPQRVEIIPTTLDPIRAEAPPAVLVIAPFADGRGLLTVERDGVLHSERFEFTGQTALLSLPPLPADAVNVRVAARVWRGRVGGAPLSAQGVVNLDLAPDTRQLALTLDAAGSLVPGAEASVLARVGEATPGVSLAAFLTDARWPAPPDAAPASVFFPLAAEGTVARATQDLLIAPRPDAPALTPPSNAPPALEAPPAPFAVLPALAGLRLDASTPPPSGLLRATTDARGEATLSVPTPEQPGDYRLVVVAFDERGRFGRASRVLHVRPPLTILPIAPRQLDARDQTEAVAAVFNHTASPITASVTLNGRSAQTLTLGPQDHAALRASLREVPDALRWEATAPLMKATATATPTRRPATPLRRAVSVELLQNAASLTVEGGELWLLEGSTPLVLAAAPLEVLLQATPASTREHATRLIALASLRRHAHALSPRLSAEADTLALANADLDALLDAQTEGGDFSSPPDAPTTLLATIALRVANENGLGVPPAALERARRRLVSAALDEPSPLGDDALRALALATLRALGERVTVKGNPGDISLAARWRSGVGGVAPGPHDPLPAWLAWLDAREDAPSYATLSDFAAILRRDLPDADSLTLALLTMTAARLHRQLRPAPLEAAPPVRLGATCTAGELRPGGIAALRTRLDGAETVLLPAPAAPLFVSAWVDAPGAWPEVAGLRVRLQPPPAEALRVGAVTTLTLEIDAEQAWPGATLTVPLPAGVEGLPTAAGADAWPGTVVVTEDAVLLHADPLPVGRTTATITLRPLAAGSVALPAPTLHTEGHPEPWPLIADPGLLIISPP